MKNKLNKIEKLKMFFEQQHCLTIDEICLELNCSSGSAKRYLNLSGYYSSYSHNSKWYTIASVCRFNRDGLWTYNSICFSKHGTLKNTIFHFIDESRSGLTSGELSQKLGVICYSVLNQLCKRGGLNRLKTSRGFVYLSNNSEKYSQQRSVLETLETLSPQIAVLVLVEHIKHPEAHYLTELSKSCITH